MQPETEQPNKQVRDNRPPQQRGCYSSFSLPSRTGFPGSDPQGNVPQCSAIVQNTAWRGCTTLPLPHSPQEPQVVLGVLTCCGKRVLDTEVKSQDTEEQAWNGGRMTETTTSAVHFTHSPKNLPSSMGSLTSKHQIQPSSASLEPGNSQFPSGRSWETPHRRLRSGAQAGCRGLAPLQKDPSWPEPREPLAQLGPGQTTWRARTDTLCAAAQL